MPTEIGTSPPPTLGPLLKVLLTAVLAGLIALVLLGPRPQLHVDERRPLIDGDLSSYLQVSESKYSDITPGAEKMLRWANPEAPAKTPWSLVYLHGFSATRQETHPLTQHVASSLGANTFYTRLAGHGRGSDPLSSVDGSRWFDDSREALAIGEALGDRVVLIGVSTGATLAVWQALDAESSVAALILISPNFALADKKSDLLNLPWGLRVAELLLGKTRSFTTLNEGHKTFWTSTYDMHAAGELMALVKHVNNMDLSQIAMPVLYIRSDRDQVIDSVVADRIFASLPSPKNQQHIVTTSDDPYGHVIAGDILSPSTTAELHQVIVTFLNTLPAEQAL